MDFNTLYQENERFFNELKFNKGLFINFLDTMAKYHKYPVQQQTNLFFHAPKTASPLMASAETWERLGTPVKKGANGIQVINEKEPEKVSFVYDFFDTIHASEENQSRLQWKYDDNLHREILLQLLPKVNKEIDTAQAIKDYCIKEVTQSPGIYTKSGYVPASAVGTATAYIVLTRMGYNAKELLTKELLTMPYTNIDSKAMLQAVNQFSGELLNPLGIQIKEDTVVRKFVEKNQVRFSRIVRAYERENITADEAYSALQETMNNAEAELRSRKVSVSDKYNKLLGQYFTEANDEVIALAEREWKQQQNSAVKAETEVAEKETDVQVEHDSTENTNNETKTTDEPSPSSDVTAPTEEEVTSVSDEEVDEKRTADIGPYGVDFPSVPISGSSSLRQRIAEKHNSVNSVNNETKDETNSKTDVQVEHQPDIAEDLYYKPIADDIFFFLGY